MNVVDDHPSPAPDVISSATSVHGVHPARTAERRWLLVAAAGMCAAALLLLLSARGNVVPAPEGFDGLQKVGSTSGTDFYLGRPEEQGLGDASARLVTLRTAGTAGDACNTRGTFATGSVLCISAAPDTGVVVAVVLPTGTNEASLPAAEGDLPLTVLDLEDVWAGELGVYLAPNQSELPMLTGPPRTS